MAIYIWISLEVLCQTGKQPALCLTNSLPQPPNLVQKLLDSDWPTFIVEWVVQKSDCFYVRTSESLQTEASGLCHPDIAYLYCSLVVHTIQLVLHAQHFSLKNWHCAMLSLPLPPLGFADVGHRQDVLWEKRSNWGITLFCLMLSERITFSHSPSCLYHAMITWFTLKETEEKTCFILEPFVAILLWQGFF